MTKKSHHLWYTRFVSRTHLENIDSGENEGGHDFLKLYLQLKKVFFILELLVWLRYTVVGLYVCGGHSGAGVGLLSAFPKLMDGHWCWANIQMTTLGWSA